MIRQNDEEFTVEIQVRFSFYFRDITAHFLSYNKRSGNMKLGWIKSEIMRLPSMIWNIKLSG